MMTEDKEEITPVGKRQYKRGKERRQDILTAVVMLLSNPKPERFTTKEIAALCGVSEACLYRHFSSKAEVLMSLIGFCETSVMTMFSELDSVEGLTYTQRATAKVRALLEFAEKNPGLTRLMTGEALVFEEDRVQQYMTHVISKAETSVRQTLKLAVVNREIAADTNVARCAEVYVSFVTGRWLRFSQSGFTKRPTEGWSFAEALLSLTEL